VGRQRQRLQRRVRLHHADRAAIRAARPFVRLRAGRGAIYSVDKVRVWHYAADGRIYNATKTQVSENGSSWYTVFDSAVSGTYAETAAGRTYTFPVRSVRYVRDYLNGSNKNAGNHWVEIEVWGMRTTAYVGGYLLACCSLAEMRYNESRSLWEVDRWS